MDQSQLERAFRNAHAAGDTQAARILAGELAKLRTVPVAATQPTMPQPEPMESQGFGSVKSGILRGLDRQWTGAKQIGSDIARFASNEIGQPYSPYREGVNAHGRQLRNESERAPVMDQFGEKVILPMAEFGAMPTGPAKIGLRIPYNALVGAGYAALDPAETPEERASKMTSGAISGGVVPPVLAGGLKALSPLGSVVRSVVSPKYGAAREIERDLGEAAKALPKDFDPMGGGTGSGRVPPGEMGPPLPPFGRIPGAKPTVAMLDPRFRELEMNARNRNKLFGERDEANQAAVYRALEKRAIPDNEANALQDVLNSKTSNTRDVAFEVARAGDPGAFSGPLEAYVKNLRTSPGLRVDRNAQQLANAADVVLGQQSLDPADFYTLRKQLDDALRSKGVSFDEMTNAAKGARKTAVEMKQAIDEGQNAASRGLWDLYLKNHREGMGPITEGRAFQDVLDKFATAKTLPGTDLPKITPHALRKAVKSETYQPLGKAGLLDVLTPQNREVANDAVGLLNAMEHARDGTVSVNGSPTASYLTSLMKSGLVPISSTPGLKQLSWVVNLADAAGRSRGASVLDQALLEPGRFQNLLDFYHANNIRVPVLDSKALRIMERTLRPIPQVINVNSR